MNDGREVGLTFRKRNPQRLLMGVADREKVMSEKVCKILLRPPLRLGVPQAGGEFVMLTFICRFT